MSSYVDRNIYDAGGHTGNTYYLRIVRRDSYIWNPTTGTFLVTGSISWAESVTLLVEIGTTGVFPVLIPRDWRTIEDIARELYDERYIDLTSAQKQAVAAEVATIKNLPAGIYDMVIYKQAGASPANTDDVEKQYETRVGDIFGF